MHRTTILYVFALAGLWLALEDGIQAADDATLAAGRELFLHRWDYDDARSPNGDGLGPLHNAKSCVACHFQGAVGGGGPAAHNVQLLTAVSGRGGAARQLHRGFASDGGTIVMHRLGRDPGYSDFRSTLLGEHAESLISSYADQRGLLRYTPELKRGRAKLRLSQRNTPALFGAGLIDRIQPEQVLANAAAVRRKYPHLKGRLPVSSDGKFGRFGWRGQTANLTSFVVDACANELGLQNPLRLQVDSPIGSTKMRRRSAAQPQAAAILQLMERQAVGGLEAAGLQKLQELAGEIAAVAASGVPSETDLNLHEVQSLIAYVAALPAPWPQPLDDPALQQRVADGRKLFGKIGCGACHSPNLGEAAGIYSDLLVHDMGPMLAGPSPSQPIVTQVSVPQPGGGSYGGGSSTTQAVTSPSLSVRQREWRTPPLWGAADSAPYLHDGRAATLGEAIEWHRGEGEFAAKRFQRLKDEERAALLLFLKTLKAPGDPFGDPPPADADVVVLDR